MCSGRVLLVCGVEISSGRLGRACRVLGRAVGGWGVYRWCWCEKSHNGVCMRGVWVSSDNVACV